jgi:membrane protein
MPRSSRNRIRDLYRRLPKRADLWAGVKGFFRFLGGVVRSHFVTHQGSLTAGGIAFFLGVNLVPLVLLGVSVFGFVLGSSEAAVEVVTRTLGDLVPESLDWIEGVVAKVVAARVEVGVVGLVVLLWLTTRLTDSVRRAIDNIWGPGRRRRWWEGRLIALAMLGGVLLLLFTSTFLTGLFARFAGSDWRLGEWDFPVAKTIIRIGLVLAPFLLSALFFFGVYRLVPTAPVSWQAAAVGALSTALFFEGAKVLFSFYLADLAAPDVYYGFLAGLVALSFWSYYAATILLLGAELAYAVEKRRDRGRLRRRARRLTEGLRGDGAG